MKYKKGNGDRVELNYILKIYFETPIYYAVEPQNFIDLEELQTVEITTGLLSLHSSTTKEIDTKECRLSNDSITVEIINKDLNETQMLYNAINSETDNIYKKEAALFISLDGILTKEFSGFITGIPTVDVFETKISLKIDNTRDILSTSVFEEQLSNNNASLGNLNNAFSVEIRTKDRGSVYDVGNFIDIFNLSNILEKDAVFVSNESGYYINETGFNRMYSVSGKIVTGINTNFLTTYQTGDKFKINGKTDIITNIFSNTSLELKDGKIDEVDEYSDDWKLKKDVDIQKIIVFGNHQGKFHLVDFAYALFTQIFNNDLTLVDKYIDYESFNYLNYDDSKNYVTYYEFYEKIDNVFDFCQNEIFKFLNAYPVINEEGKLKLIKQKQPEVAESVNVVDRDKIINVTANNNDFSNLITNVNINYNYSFRDEEFKTEPQNYQSDTIAKYGKSPKKPYEYNVKFDYRMTEVEKNTFNQIMANYLFERYADRLKVLSFDLLFSNKVINEGDYIKLDHSLLIDWEEGDNTGLRGINLNPESPDLIINDGDQWGNFIGNSKDNSIGYFNDYKVIKVDRDVNTTFFNEKKSLANNQWNTKYNVPARFYAPKGVGADEGNYGDIK